MYSLNSQNLTSLTNNKIIFTINRHGVLGVCTNPTPTSFENQVENWVEL